jgi:hypothetical protein
MGNHVHLLLEEGQESISDTMKRIGVSFVWYYNKKYFTTGHLFPTRKMSGDMKAGIVPGPDQWKWSSCSGYYGLGSTPKGLLDCDFILYLFADNLSIAQARFKEFNEAENDDECLGMGKKKLLRLNDEEAGRRIAMLLKEINIPQVKSLPKTTRDEVLRKVKTIEGLSHRQAARILGVSPNLVFKA